MGNRRLTGPADPKVDVYVARLKSWRAESTRLRELIRRTELQETFKWGHPCYALEGANVALIHGFKSYCALLFFKGALMKDEPRSCSFSRQGTSSRGARFGFKSHCGNRGRSRTPFCAITSMEADSRSSAIRRFKVVKLTPAQRAVAGGVRARSWRIRPGSEPRRSTQTDPWTSTSLSPAFQPGPSRPRPRHSPG